MGPRYLFVARVIGAVGVGIGVYVLCHLVGGLSLARAMACAATAFILSLVIIWRSAGACVHRRACSGGPDTGQGELSRQVASPRTGTQETSRRPKPEVAVGECAVSAR